MSGEKLEKIVNLLTSYKLQFSSKSELTHLECVHCGSIIRDALQLPCGCKYCRNCLEALKEDGSEFCRGLSEDCKGALLASNVPDYSTNQMISRLEVKCPMESCLHECALAVLDDHLRACLMNSAECPFQRFGCEGDKLSVHEMEAHFQQGQLSHSKILIDIITNINNGLTELAHTDQTNRHQMESLEHQIVAKDDQITLVLAEVRELREENVSIKTEMQSMKERVGELTQLLSTLCDKVDKEIKELCARRDAEADSRGLTEPDILWVKEHRESMAQVSMASTIRDAVDLATREFEDRINREVARTVEDGLVRQSRDISQAIDAYFVWTVQADNMQQCENSDTFLGVKSRYTYRLSMWNCDQQSQLHLRLALVYSDIDSELQWPFKGTVTMVVAERSHQRKCKIASRHCDIERPLLLSIRYDFPFIFDYSDWPEVQHHWQQGVTVTCIVCVD